MLEVRPVAYPRCQMISYQVAFRQQNTWSALLLSCWTLASFWHLVLFFLFHIVFDAVKLTQHPRGKKTKWNRARNLKTWEQGKGEMPTQCSQPSLNLYEFSSCPVMRRLSCLPPFPGTMGGGESFLVSQILKIQISFLPHIRCMMLSTLFQFWMPQLLPLQNGVNCITALSG